jgi:hypothetical protein
VCWEILTDAFWRAAHYLAICAHGLIALVEVQNQESKRNYASLIADEGGWWMLQLARPSNRPVPISAKAGWTTLQNLNILSH